MGKGGGETITFKINGKAFNLNVSSTNIGPRLMLVDFIRDTANLKGTKSMCREGGCGACVVTARTRDPLTGKDVVKAVNSCLTPVFSCNGWNISTVEDLGNKKDGLSALQNRLVKFHGTQCGFCTPGMVMSMNSLLESKGKVTVKDVEDNFDGNICRCTGYRPILDAFKSLAVDAPEVLRKKCADIEDCGKCPCANQNGTVCNGTNGIQNGDCHADKNDTLTNGTNGIHEVKNGGCCSAKNKILSNGTNGIQNGGCCGVNKSTVDYPTPLELQTGETWLGATSLEDVFVALQKCKSEGLKYRFVAGNTATGVYRDEGAYKVFIDVNNVPELHKLSIADSGVILGAGTTLTQAISILKTVAVTDGFEYTASMSKHIERVANVPVRNNGTLAGNLMIKHKHNEFPSDIFMLLETVGAEICFAGDGNAGKWFKISEFLNVDMNGKILVSIRLPKRKGYTFRSFKITRRFQNSHAYVNAGILIRTDTTHTVLEKPRLVYGGIHPKFIHASATESYLENKSLADPKVIRGALEALDKEIQPDVCPPEANPKYRKQLTKSLLYKAILGVVGSKTGNKIQSGGLDMARLSSSGKQMFDTDATETTLYKETPKLESKAQVSGEAEYVNDIVHRDGELFGVYVLADIPCGELKSIDASEALKVPGVVQFISAKDIPAMNNYAKYCYVPTVASEPVFVSDKVSYHGQPIGMILAENRNIAEESAKLVKATYKNVTKPIVDIGEALKAVETAGTLDQHYLGTFKSHKPAEVSKYSIKGEFRVGSQYHNYMETQSCLCIPTEDGMDVFSATQWMDHTQITIAEVLGIPSNHVNMQVRRLGGGFGGKVMPATFLAAGCAVAANAAKRPVRVVLNMDTNMRMMGKRLPYLMRYEAGFDDTGKIGSLKAELFCDTGYSPNESTSVYAVFHLQNVYDAIGWEIKAGFVTTNTPSNTATRAPGSPQGTALIEYIMEHVAHTLNKDPLEVRMANIIKEDDPMLIGDFADLTKVVKLGVENLIPRMIQEIKSTADYEKRKELVKKFNEENRWIKRGLSLVPMRYQIGYYTGKFQASVVVYATDGTVSVTHAGIEMGQGMHTKVAQTVAETLQIPLSKIQVKPSNNFIGANATCTGGSIGSELCSYAALRACEALLERLKPVRDTLDNPSWETLIAESHKRGIELSGFHSRTVADNLEGYQVWALVLTEVEIDVLTGENKVVRVDVLEDAGKSLSPGIDIGQVEGAYIFGQGLWTTERIVHDEHTGKLLTDRTWDYKPPESKDIPEDMRISLLSNTPNMTGVLRSKATGEPIMCGAVAVVFALRQAIASARQDAGNTEWFQIDGPVTPEDVARLCLTSDSQLTL